MDSKLSAGQPPALSIGLFNHFSISCLEGTPTPPNKPVAPSRAADHILIYLTEGEVHATIGESRYVSQEEEVLVIPAGQIFSIDTYGPDRINRGFLVHFGEPTVRQYEFLDVLGNPRTRFGPLHARWAEGVLEEMCFFYRSKWERNRQFVDQRLVSLLTWISLDYRPLFFRAPEKGRALTQQFRKLLHQHYQTKQRVQDYAELLGVTPNHLNRVVKETSSRSPARWIDGAILTEAKLLLAQTALPMAEVAAQVGVGDPSYFARMFGKYVGMTPGEYRCFWEGEKND